MTIVMDNIIHLGYVNEERDNALPSEFSLLAIQPGEDHSIAYKIAHILCKNRLIEFIIIPDRYFFDLEVLQTIQMRNEAHAKKNGVGIVITATDAARILNDGIVPHELWCKVYKISTIRHGFEYQTNDENADLLLNFAQHCVVTPGSNLLEIVIRACGSAGSLQCGLADPITLEPIGTLYSHTGIDEETAKQSRLFLSGHTGESGTPAYKDLKQLTIRTQTLSIKNVALTEPEQTNVAYTMRKKLDLSPQLRHLSIKAYYEVVNPVPEGKPTRMGLWSSSKKVATLSFPKAVRLLPPDDTDVGSEKPNHLTRLVNQTI